MANTAALCFYSFWGIFSALAFDFHDNVIGAMAVPWMFYYVDSRQFKKAGLALAWLLISKENMGLWAFSLLTGMAFIYRKDKSLRNILLAGSLLSIMYSVIVIKFVIPSLADSGIGYRHLKYSALGKSFEEIIFNLVKAPHLFFDFMIKSQFPDPIFSKIKSDFYMFLFLSGGFVLIYKPVYLWMILPLLAQKFFNDNAYLWGVEYHYNIEFAAILPVAIYDFSKSYIREIKYQKLAFLLIALMGIVSTFSLMQKNRSLYYHYENIRFYSKEHYQAPYDVKELNQALNLIPKDAVVCASQKLSAHLALRDTLYIYPDVLTASYIAILMDGVSYPISPEDLVRRMNDLRNNKDWELIYEKNLTYIFRQRGKTHS
jgi:uncharacterized membrane protein